MKKNAPLLLIALFLSCSADKEKLNEKQIIGKWQNLSLNLTMKNHSKDSILTVKEGEWQNVMGIKPIVTTFTTDSTFISEYFTTEGQNFHTIYGKWWIRNDSLVMLSENGKTTYHLTVDNNQARFRSILDWDQDGESDDLYDGVQIKIE